MSTRWLIALVVAAAAVFGVTGYVLASRGSVPNAGQIVGYTPPPSPSPSSAAPTGTPRPALRPAVAFLGDDYTSGAGASTPSRRFTSLVSTALGWDERNFGVPRTGYADSRGGRDYRSRVNAVVAAHPKMVIVSGGRNDVIDNVDTIATDARELFADLHARLPKAKLIAIAPLWGDSPPPSILAQIATSVRAAVRAAGGTYLAIQDPVRGHRRWMHDLADPNDAGHAAIARVVQSALVRIVSPAR